MRNKRRVYIVLTCGLIAMWIGVRIFWPKSVPLVKLPTGTAKVVVSLGASHGLVLAGQGSLWSWGSAFEGWPVLGLGEITNQPVLRRIGNETNWMSISAGHSHNLAIKSDGTLWAWGQNVYGQFGNGTKGVRSNVFAMIDVPVPGAPGKDWKQAVAGGSHSFGIKRDGTLWAWGNNWAGQLGISSTNDSLVPVQIGLSTNWVKVWAGLCNGAGLQSDGSLWFWGDNPALRTQVGRSGRNLLAPQLISPGVRWVDAAFGNMLVLGVTSDGLLLAWGRYAINYSTNSAPADVPVGIGSDSDWAACYSAEWARELYAVLRKKNGTIWIMESSVATGNKVRFTEVMVPKPFVALAAGGGGGLDANGMHDGVCAGVGLSNDGEVWTWGRGLGALGYTRGQPALQFCASLAGRIGVGVHWGYPRPIPSGNEPRVVEVEPER